MGKIVEKKTGEKYASKKAMIKHEKSEGKKEQKMEMKGKKHPMYASKKPMRKK